MKYKYTVKDFDHLVETMMDWKGIGWEDQLDRFTGDISFNWSRVYWFESPAAMILGKQFLDQQGCDYQESYDLVLDQYIILTNYRYDYELVIA